jgi:hypothetical protein
LLIVRVTRWGWWWVALATALVAVAGRADATTLRLFRPAALALAGANRPLRLDRGALATLRTLDAADVTGFPLGDGRTVTLRLRRTTPFADGGHLELMTADGPQRLAAPDVAWFTGDVAGDPDGLVVLAAAADHVHGFVATAGDVHPFGPDATGAHRTYAFSGVDPARHPQPGAFCGNDAAPVPLEPPPGERPAPLPTTAATATTRIAEVAIDTDTELRAHFASDAAALAYLGTLLTAATAIYERDLGVQLQAPYVRLWSAGTTDPWTATDTYGALLEVRDHWNAPANGLQAAAGHPDVVHFVSGKTVRGGIAYLDVLCNASWGYGVSQVYGAFDLADPTAIWDVEVFTHELGHNFGTPHTHCYVPPLDHCYAGESGCYAGPAAASQGTIMSYCHLQPGGLANITLAFGTTVSQRIGQSVAAASCLAAVPATTTTSAPATTTSTTSTTAPAAGSTTTTTASTTTLAATTTTSTGPSTSTTAAASTTTSSTLPRAVDTDADGVLDGADACPGTPAGDLVDDAGCSACPCAGPRQGGAWRGRSAYLHCVRAELRRRAVLGLDVDRRAALRRAQRATCGRPATTRCCVGDGDAASCRVVRTTTCVAAGSDAGPGSCLPSPCP